MKSSTIIILMLVSYSPGQRVGTNGMPVPEVAGESWLDHLHRPLNVTSMGKTWHLGPPANSTWDENRSSQGESGLSLESGEPTVTLHGGDLYRINCQGCHGESGLGAPPEIGSVINPVRATSVKLVLERMNGMGMAISRTQAAELAGQSMNALLQRLHNGGQEMPPFSYLRESEVRSLVAYLKQLAGVPGAERGQVAVKELPERVGELMVKSTCHICHSATGSNPSPQELLAGAIPPLNTLTTRTSSLELIRKVTKGAPIIMGTPPLPCRGRMPVFYYFSRAEAADVYLYLARHPRYEPPVLDISLSTGSEPMNISSPPEVPVVSGVVILIGVGWVALLMGGCAWITVREFRRLSAESVARRTAARTDQTISPVMPMISTKTGGLGSESQPPGWATLRKKIS